MFDLSHEAVLDPILDDVNASPEILPAEPEAPTTGDKALEEQLRLYAYTDEPPPTDLGDVIVRGQYSGSFNDLLVQHPGLFGFDFEGFDGDDFIDDSGGGDVGQEQGLPTCVSDKPEISDESMFMRVISDLTRAFRGDYNGIEGNLNVYSSQYEYGVLIYELNGVIGHTNIVTDYRPDEVGVSTTSVPDGARIVAFMHNHPDVSFVDDRIPSIGHDGDWQRRNNFISSNLGRGITIDSNLLLVLYTNEDNRTRIYYKSDEETTRSSCPVRS